MKNKLFQFLLILFLIPLNIYAIPKKVIVGGETIGIEVYSDGIYVVGFYEVNNKMIGKDAGFKVGDIIKEINNVKINNISDINNLIKESNTYDFKIIRNYKEKDISFKLEEKNNIIKTGLYVKNKIDGIGTLSYINPETKTFASLGHEILESNSMSKFIINSGNIYKAEVTNIKKSEERIPGEKQANINFAETIGTIDKNEINGIYGKYNGKINENNTIDVGKKEEIKKGEAIIRTVVNNETKEDFSINILTVDENDPVKNILFEITDSKLLDKTNGIIQGMSGSPIIQDEKIVGAVTHVVVDHPEKGYGIFITNMLKEAEN